MTGKSLLIIALIVLFAQTLSVTSIVQAADTDGPTVTTSDTDKPQKAELVTLTNPLSKKYDSIGGIVQGFVEIFSYIVVLGAVLALIWVGLQFILARGDPKKMNELKGWLFYIIIGVAVVIGARIIIQVVINTLSASGVVDQRTIQSAENALRTP